MELTTPEQTQGYQTTGVIASHQHLHDQFCVGFGERLVPAAYNILVASVDEGLARRGLSHRWNGDTIEFAIPDQGEISLGMFNLVRVMMSSAPEDWRGAVENHLAIIDTILATTPRQMDFAEVRSSLRVRIAPNAERAADIIERPLAPGLRLGIVVDYPECISTLTRVAVEHWGASDNEFFGIALSNMPPFVSTSHEVHIVNGLNIEVVENDSCYGAITGVLALPLLVNNVNPGALVGIPNRDTIAFHQVVDAHSIEMAQTLVAATMTLFQHSPYSLARIPYWWHNGTFEVFSPAPVGGGRAILLPPVGLLRLLGITDVSVSDMTPRTVRAESRPN